MTRADERMNWLTWSNPVAIWWMFLLAVSAVNVALLLGLRALYRRFFAERRMSLVAAEPLLFLSACRRLRLRVPLGVTARRRSTHLSVRHAAFERPGRPFGRDYRRAVLHHPVGHSAARTCQIR